MSQAPLNQPDQERGQEREQDWEQERVPRQSSGGRLPRFADAAVSRARLSLVAPSRSEAPLAPFVAVLFVVLIGGVAGLLAFNTSMQQTSFAATRLEDRAATLSAQRQSLQIDLADLSDPQALAARAKDLGMVVPTSPAFVRLSDGRILGDPQPAVPDQAMRINPLPAAKPKVLAPAPKVIEVPRKKDREKARQQNQDDQNGRDAQRGSTRSGGSATDDQDSTTSSPGGQG